MAARHASQDMLDDRCLIFEKLALTTHLCSNNAMQSAPSRRKRRLGVLSVPLQEVPWHWQALALLVFNAMAAAVIEESIACCRGSPATTSATLVDINFGTQEELESLNGIGPVLAKMIIVGRPYASTGDLVRVSGIGPEQAARLLPFVKASRGRRHVDQR